MDTKFNADVIVVGAGPSGVAAALSIAKSNKKVILVERASYPGSKNMYGGAVYTTALKEVFGDDLDEDKMNKTIDGILSKNKDAAESGDWGKLVGILNKSF